MKFYIGKKDCGCVVFACVDEPEYKDDTAESLAEAIRDGYTIEHIESDVGPKLQSCRCGQTMELPL